jgi:hypothetical protein
VFRHIGRAGRTERERGEIERKLGVSFFVALDSCSSLTEFFVRRPFNTVPTPLDVV